MTRRRLLVVAVGAGVLLAGLPAVAEVDGGRLQSSADEVEAVALLERAAAAGRRLTYTGTQYVASWRGGGADTTLVDLEHDPVRGSVVHGAAGAHPETAGGTAVLDPRMLDRLAASYDLAVSGPGRCAGRAASVIEARRADGVVAGRFWVDRDSGMLLRREVFDTAGQRVRSSAFVDLAVGDAAPAPVLPSRAPRAERPAPETLEQLRADGWHVPADLPAGFRLFETRLDGAVLHLAYTDGLSTLSVFAQRGQLGREPMDGFTRETVEDRPVWVRRAAPERVVWSGDERVFTLVSDAPEDAVRAAVVALPHGAPADNGLLARLARGTSRLAGMLNPFD